MEVVEKLFVIGIAALIFFVGTIALTAVLSLVGGIPVFFLWNWLAPIFGLPQLTFFQAWGLLWLCSILFKTHSTSASTE